MRIAEEDLTKIRAMAEEIERINNIIGAGEVQKMRLISKSNEITNDINSKIKISMIKAGVPENEIQDNIIDIKSGEISAKEKK